MKGYLNIILIYIGLNSYAQDRIAVETSSAQTIIETYSKSYSSFDLDKAYRLGPTSTKTLKEGIRISLKWIELNATYLKDFEKEICRFKAMKKTDFEFHGYNDHLADEMILNFKGNSDGTFLLEIKTFYSSAFISLSDKNMVISFRDLLDGKSTNKEIDDIFKN